MPPVLHKKTREEASTGQCGGRHEYPELLCIPPQRAKTKLNSEGNPENSKRNAFYVAPSVPAPENEAAAEPTAAEPATAEPTTAELTTAEPTTAAPTTAEPTTAERARRGPVVRQRRRSHIVKLLVVRRSIGNAKSVDQRCVRQPEELRSENQSPEFCPNGERKLIVARPRQGENDNNELLHSPFVTCDGRRVVGPTR